MSNLPVFVGIDYVVQKGAIPFEMDKPRAEQKKIPCSELYGCMEIWMADDFDEPLEEMREYSIDKQHR